MGLECEYDVYEVLSLPLGIICGEVFEDVWGRARVCLDISPQDNDCGVVSCVVLCDFVFRGFKVYMGCLPNIANVCCGIDGWDWGCGLF